MYMYMYMYIQHVQTVYISTVLRSVQLTLLVCGESFCELFVSCVHVNVNINSLCVQVRVVCGSHVWSPLTTLEPNILFISLSAFRNLHGGGRKGHRAVERRDREQWTGEEGLAQEITFEIGRAPV